METELDKFLAVEDVSEFLDNNDVISSSKMWNDNAIPIIIGEYNNDYLSNFKPDEDPVHVKTPICCVCKQHGVKNYFVWRFGDIAYKMGFNCSRAWCDIHLDKTLIYKIDDAIKDFEREKRLEKRLEKQREKEVELEKQREKEVEVEVEKEVEVEEMEIKTESQIEYIKRCFPKQYAACIDLNENGSKSVYSYKDTIIAQ